MLRENVQDLLRRIKMELTPLSRLRMEFCGTKYDRPQLEAKGWELACQDGCVAWHDRRFTHDGQDWTIRLLLHEKGYLRDVQAFSVNPEAALNKIWTEQLIDLPFEVQVREMLQQGILEPAPPSADEDLDAMCWGWKAEVSGEYSERGKQSLIMVARAEALKEDDPGTARRYVTGVARWSPCLEPVTMEANLAYNAAILGLRAEAATLLMSSLDAGDESADFWNQVGCVLEQLGEKRLSFDCFRHAAGIDPEQPDAAGNVWLLGMPLLQAGIRAGDFRAALEDADALLAFADTATDEQKRDALGASGLCCEGLGLLDEAGERYTSLLDAFPDSLVAGLGLNRRQETDGTVRRAALERQLASFPRVPQEVGGPESLPVEFIEGYHHGDHWEAIVPSVEAFFDSQTSTILKNMSVLAKDPLPPCERVRATFDEAAASVFPSDEPVCSMALLSTFSAENRAEVLTMFPCAADGTSVTLKPIKFQEWNNGIEGSVELEAPGTSSLTAFFPLYFQQRKALKPDRLYPFALTGLAMSFRPAEDHEFEVAEGPVTLDKDGNDRGPQKVVMGEECSMLFPSFEYPGEYSYRLPVLDVGWMEFMGHKVFRMASKYEAGEDVYPITLYAGEHHLDGHVPKPGDAVEGNLWLQAHLLLEEGRPLEAPDDQEDRRQPAFGRTSYTRDPEGLLGIKADSGEYALNASGGVKRFADIPLRLKNQPQFIAETTTGERCYVYVQSFSEDDQDWEQAKQEAETLLETRISHRDHPLHIMGMGRRAAGKGYLLSYHDWAPLDGELPLDADDDSSSEGGVG